MKQTPICPKKARLPRSLKARQALLSDRLSRLYPNAECALDYKGDPFRLLVMARLSAQCTDRRVNEISPALFSRFPDALAFAEADQAELERYIFSTGMYREKARQLIAMARMLLTEFGGRVPETQAELLKLPGVGRKTANLLMGDLYAIPGSIVCDTHCIRICGRLGLSKGKEPEKVERQLRKILPPEKSSDFCHRIVLFGREICTARSPKCTECPLAIHCKYMNG